MVQRNPRRSADQWAAIVADYHDSGLSIQAFCEQKNLVPVTFHKWRRRLSSPPLEPTDSKPAFVPASRVEPRPSAHSSVTVQIGPAINLTITLYDATHEQ